MKVSKTSIEESERTSLRDDDFKEEKRDVESGEDRVESSPTTTAAADAAAAMNNDSENDGAAATLETTVVTETEKSETNEVEMPSSSSRYKKVLVGLVLVGFIVFVIVDSTTNGHIRDGIQTFLRWIQENPIGGFFLFMGVYLIATVLFVPGLILTLGSGFVFSNAFGMGLGLVVAIVSVFVGASLGSIAAFLISRYVLRDWAQGLTKKYPIFRAIDTALEEKGLRIMILLRLSPIIPFNALNYICGVTAVSFRHYAVALVAILPGTVLYVFLGSSAQSLASIGSSTNSAALTISTVVVGVVLGVVAVALSSRYAKKELNKILKRDQQASDIVTTAAERNAMDEDKTMMKQESRNEDDADLEVLYENNV